MRDGHRQKPSTRPVAIYAQRLTLRKRLSGSQLMSTRSAGIRHMQDGHWRSSAAIEVAQQAWSVARRPEAPGPSPTGRVLPTPRALRSIP
jgi:hypothetical protein